MLGKRIFLFRAMVLWIGLVLFGSGLYASQYVFSVGTTLTLKNVPLIGISGSVAILSEPNDRTIYEYQLLSHVLRGIVFNAPGGDGFESGVLIEMETYEFGFYHLFLEDNYYWGPGVGYGIAQTREVNQAESRIGQQDPSPFFSAKDIHYGVLLLKIGKTFGKYICELNVSSFGGLIGGSALCGITY